MFTSSSPHAAGAAALPTVMSSGRRPRRLEVQTLLNDFLNKRNASSCCLAPTRRQQHDAVTTSKSRNPNVLTINIPMDGDDALDIIDFLQKQQQHVNTSNNDTSSRGSKGMVMLELCEDYLSQQACQVFCDYFQSKPTSNHDNDDDDDDGNKSKSYYKLSVTLWRLKSITQTRHLLQALSQCTFVQDLYLIQLPALSGAAGGTLLSDFLLKRCDNQTSGQHPHSRLQHLLVAYSALGPSGAQALQPGLSSSQDRPQQLSLISCNLGDTGVEAIVNACLVVHDNVDNNDDTNKTNVVQELDLSINQITSRGLHALTKLRGVDLQNLKLRYNPGILQDLVTTRDFCQTMLLSTSSSRYLGLHTLDVEGCQVSVPAAVLILQALEQQQANSSCSKTKTMPTLRVLNLGHVVTSSSSTRRRQSSNDDNSDDEDEALLRLQLHQQLVTSLPRWHGLRQLNLYNFDFDTHLTLRQALHNNTSLLSLSTRGSDDGRECHDDYNSNICSSSHVVADILQRNQLLVYACDFLHNNNNLSLSSWQPAIDTTLAIALAALGSQSAGTSAVYHVLQQQLPYWFKS